MERKILIEIEEPDFMDLVNSEEKEELDGKVIEIIRSRVLELSSAEMRKLLKERDIICLSCKWRGYCEDEDFQSPNHHKQKTLIETWTLRSK